MAKVNKTLKRLNYKLLIFLFVFLLGVGLRLWKYPFYPFAGHAEEYLFVWSGVSLIEQGVPISWNDIPVYGEENIYFEGVAENPAGGGGIGVRLLKPWLDQPPLYSLIAGSMGVLYGLDNFTVVSPYAIRIPALLFSFVTMAFVFLLAKRYFGYWVGILSLLIYGTVPTIVFGSRLSVPENMITALMIAILWLILDYLKTNVSWKRNLAIFLAVLAALAKPTGFLLVPFIVFLLWKEKRWKEGLLSGLAGTAGFFIPYFLYGAYYDWDLFWGVFNFQAQRPAGWSSLAFIFTNPGFSVEVFLDGFIVLGIIALAYLAFKRRSEGENMVLLSFVFSLLVVAISGGRHDQLAWYRYPIYPYMAIATALLVREIYKNPTFFASAIFVPLSLANADLLENPFARFKFLFNVRFYRPVFALLLAPSIGAMILDNKNLVRLSRIVVVVVFLAGIGFNIWVVKSWFNLLCDHTTCPLPHKIDLFKPIFLR